MGEAVCNAAMTDWGKYKNKPDENTFGKYPTILDIMESLADYETESQVRVRLTTTMVGKEEGGYVE